MAFSSLILSTWLSMKLWPPKPGLTDMIRTRSTSSRTYSMADRGVPGLRTTPAAQPSALMLWTVLCRWIVDAASQWTEMMSAPAFAKSSMRLSGSTIMRWQSITASGYFLRSASTTSGPMVMLGTKRPSIASMWTQSAPALRASPTSSPKREKSAERMEGEIFTDFSPERSAATRGFSALHATARCDRAAAGLPARRARTPPATRAAAPATAIDADTAPPTAGTAAGAALGICAASWPTTAPVARSWGPTGTKAAAQPNTAGTMRALDAMSSSEERGFGRNAGGLEEPKG
mmetsp:Transcript_5214/g.13762  ORF Transcript_5214/g.13762 Transcript_5214/m.13762 type:complete len:290 (+) Transcript_5214:342-1211(+)